MMRAYARRILPGTAEVDDVVQDALITAWAQLPTLDDPGRFKSWVMRITGRKAIDRIRSMRETVDVENVERAVAPEVLPARQAEVRAEVSALGEALSTLPDAQRQCWVMRELGGYAYEEIAEELDIPASTVRGLLSRARKSIIARMDGWR